MAKSKVTFPDGTEVEFAKDTSPEQIQAILQALQGARISSASLTSQSTQGEVIEPELTAEQIWEQGSKREKLALFIRNHFMPSDWFTTKQVLKEQIEFVKTIVFGESPAIATYLNRLHEDGFLDKSKRGKLIHYQLRPQILEEYPQLQLDEIHGLMQTELQE